jgi:hypothetical protein
MKFDLEEVYVSLCPILSVTLLDRDLLDHFLARWRWRLLNSFLHLLNNFFTPLRSRSGQTLT